ncbi:MAG: hypothetical protein Q9218_004424 [Villophora microphyllina]
MAAVRDSDQIVEAYKEHLSDLVINNKHEINTLTTIANECISEAPGIVRVIENHIRNVTPERKLPALYVLDSVAKNVGGAYTQLLGRNLFQTFMGAYSLVSPQIRRKLDEMVKTWKEPVPGSTNLRPVFPPETTRPIETALIRFRTIAVQSAQQDQRQQRPSMTSHNMMNPSYPMAAPQAQWRDTATPQQGNGYYQQPNAQTYPQTNGYPQVRKCITEGIITLTSSQRPPYPDYNQNPPAQPTPPIYQAPYQPPNPYASQPSPLQDLSSILQEIEHLIFTTKHEFAARHWDTGLQIKLKALLDLQLLLKNQRLLPHQIQQVRDQVTELVQTSQPAPRATALPPVPMSLPDPAPTPIPSSYAAPPSSITQPSADLGSLITSNALADILASAARAKQSTPVPSVSPNVPHPPYPPVSTPQAPPNPTAAPSSSTASLLDNLKALGVIASHTSAPNGGIATPQPPSQFPPPPQVSLNAPIVKPANTSRSALAEVRNEVVLSNASLKIPRPHAIKAKLFDARPNQCSTCGQRFLVTEEGKKKKARHLDWHFQTNQRLADAARRIQSRSWYVDEMEWIKFRDDIDEELEAENGVESAQAKAAAEAAKNDPKNKRIPVPSDPSLSSAPCPICQEKFEPSWDDETQDFVWRDAVQIGSRVYHASCHAEIRKDGASTPMRTATPDSVLGKRKAGILDLNATRSKAQKSPALAAATIATSTA